jgi:hypothetical protein
MLIYLANLVKIFFPSTIFLKMYLNTHTYYSLRYGTINPESLLQQAKQCGVSTMALTDINSTSASLDFVRLASKYGIKPVLGVDFRNKAQQQFIIIAKNNKALQQVYEYLSEFLHSKKKHLPNRAKHIPDTYVIYPFQNNITELKENEFLGVKPSDLNQLKFSKRQKKAACILRLSPMEMPLRKS